MTSITSLNPFNASLGLLSHIPESLREDPRIQNIFVGTVLTCIGTKAVVGSHLPGRIRHYFSQSKEDNKAVAKVQWSKAGLGTAALLSGGSLVCQGVMGLILKNPADSEDPDCRVNMQPSQLQPNAGCLEKMKESVGTTQQIRDVFGGATRYCSLPELSWERSFFREPGGYMHEMGTDQVPVPVMRGTEEDCGRPFLALKTFDANGQNERVTTVFARYSDPESSWVSSGFYGIGPDKVVEALRNLTQSGRAIFSGGNERNLAC